MTILNSVFFDRPAVRVAHDLIGCGLNWNHGEESVSRPITETEAYVGPDDLASHAARGRTETDRSHVWRAGNSVSLFRLWNALDAECCDRPGWLSRCGVDPCSTRHKRSSKTNESDGSHWCAQWEPGRRGKWCLVHSGKTTAAQSDNSVSEDWGRLRRACVVEQAATVQFQA